jgi:hypothetical protein
MVAESLMAGEGHTRMGVKAGVARHVTYGNDPFNRHTWDAAMVQGCDCDPGAGVSILHSVVAGMPCVSCI